MFPPEHQGQVDDVQSSFSILRYAHTCLQLGLQQASILARASGPSLSPAARLKTTVAATPDVFIPLSRLSWRKHFAVMSSWLENNYQQFATQKKSKPSDET